MSACRHQQVMQNTRHPYLCIGSRSVDACKHHTVCGAQCIVVSSSCSAGQLVAPICWRTGLKLLLPLQCCTDILQHTLCVLLLQVVDKVKEEGPKKSKFIFFL